VRTPSLAAPIEGQVAALEHGQAFVELRGWRLVEVRGVDARAWLHDLVTADVRTLEPGNARRSLILTPTGRIRADLWVTPFDDAFALLQAPDQPEAVDLILAPYVLSSDVALEDLSERWAAFAVLGTADAAGARWWRPSVLAAGAGAAAPAGEPAHRLRAALADALTEVSADAVERWRIRRGTPRMGPDFGADALPAEAGLEGAIDFTKGCFLGQESVAKVRNLGHPPRAVVAVRSASPLRPGMPVLAGGEEVGEVTSAGEGVDAIVRIRWSAAGNELSSPAGPLTLR
jgi:tRNA-modifying protein YgfZ